MADRNLINGQKPEFGNLEHIAFVKKVDRIFRAVEPFYQVEWGFCHYWGAHTDTGKPKYRYCSFRSADAVVDLIPCPKCGRVHVLLVAYDPQLAHAAWCQVLLEIDESVKEFECWNCKTSFRMDEERNLYINLNKEDNE